MLKVPSQTPQTPQLPSSETIDPDGDLILSAGSSPSDYKRFLVSRNTLRLASPVWKSKISSGKGHGAIANEVRMSDASEIMRLILLLAHLQTEKTPSMLPLQKIVELARSCARYKCPSVARDRVELWMQKYTGEGIHWVDDAAGWVFVGWTFGLRDIFTQGVGFVLEHETPAVISELAENKFPPGIKAFLVQRTHNRISSILTTAYTSLTQVIRRRIPCRTSTSSTTDTARCELERIGTITKFFTSLSLPLDDELKPPPLKLLCSLNDIFVLMTKLRGDVYTELSAIKHGECFADMDGGFLSPTLVECSVGHEAEGRFEDGIEAHFREMQHPAGGL